MSPITTHVLDTARGRPAVGMYAILERQTDSGYVELARGCTDQDGRLRNWWTEGQLTGGRYQIRFETEAYFRGLGCEEFFYPEICLRFEVRDGDGHYHVPLLLSPFGYSTYRGS